MADPYTGETEADGSTSLTATEWNNLTTLFNALVAEFNTGSGFTILGEAIGIDGDDTEEEALDKLNAAIGADGLTDIYEAAVLAADTDTINLANANANTLAFSASGPMLAILGNIAAIDAAQRAEAYGAILAGPDGPMNPGEMLSIDEDGNVTGQAFTAADPEDIIAGETGLLPQDPEAMRAVYEYEDVTGDISN
jgi:hypothetical protein